MLADLVDCTYCIIPETVKMGGGILLNIYLQTIELSFLKTYSSPL